MRWAIRRVHVYVTTLDDMVRQLKAADATGRLANKLRTYHTADPVHLMRVFDIRPATAIKYVAIAHPDKFGIDPTQA